MRYVSFVLGLILIIAALFASSLGIDNDPGWGGGRLALLVMGLLLALPALAVHLYKTKTLPQPASETIASAASRLRGWALRAARFYPLTTAAVVLVCLGMAFYGGWLASAGRFPLFSNCCGYYPRLADAFLHGQLSLLDQPDPKLLALPNPYDMGARNASGAKILWDASLYNGKYYVYWGPVPAAILAAGKWIGGTMPKNSALAWILYAGLVAVLAGVLHLARRLFYPRAPGISIPIFLLAAGLNLHLLWLVGRTSVYETSILSGQFFLFLGLLFWMLYLRRSTQWLWLALAGLSWGLAAGSRNTLLVSIAVYALFAGLRLLRSSGWRVRRWPWLKLAALAAPLLLIGAALAWYNYARFGSLTETGMTYQLSLAVSPKHYFSAQYVPSNLYMWLSYPFNVSETFPFFPFRVTYNLQFPAWAPRPPFKMFDREFYGLLPSLPVTWLLLLAAVFTLVRKFVPSRPRSLSKQPKTTENTGETFQDETLAPDPGRLDLAAMVGLAGLAQFGVLMAFFYAATRYGADFTLPAVLLAVLLTWEMDLMLVNHPKWRTGLWALAAILALATVVIGVFGVFNAPEMQLRTTNPDLYNQLAVQWNAVGRYAGGALRLAGKVFSLVR